MIINFEYSPKVIRLSTSPKHHFFGYYGINPWDKSGQYHLTLETDFHTHRPVVSDVASVGLVDRETQEFIPYAKTSAFNLQQGSVNNPKLKHGETCAKRIPSVHSTS